MLLKEERKRISKEREEGRKNAGGRDGILFERER